MANLVDFHVRETLDWPMASAVAVVLLLISAVFIIALRARARRATLRGAMSAVPDPNAPPAEPTTLRPSWASAASAWIVYFFLIMPTLIVIPMSFGDKEEFQFPPDGISFYLYRQFFFESSWMDTTFQSFRVALITTALALVFGVTRRLRHRARKLSWQADHHHLPAQPDPRAGHRRGARAVPLSQQLRHYRPPPSGSSSATSCTPRHS